MVFLFNDYSLNGQFNDIDEFTSEVNISFIPMLKHIRNKKIDLLKNFTTYARKVTDKMSLIDVFYLKGNAEVTLIKSYLVSLYADDPYWNNDIQTNVMDNYDCICTDDIPNCFTEALERGNPVISIRNKDFMSDKLSIKKNGKECFIHNAYDEFILLNIMHSFGLIDETYYVESLGIGVEFCSAFGHTYTQEFLNINEINSDDKKIIISDMITLSNHILARTDPGHLSKYLNEGIWELRSNISEKRITRIFYTLIKGKIIFLNGFIKKTQKTPRDELTYAQYILKSYLHNVR